MSTGHINEILDSIYASVLNPSSWSEALAKIVESADSVGVTLELHDKVSGELLFLQASGMDPAANDLYSEHFISVCPRIPAAFSAPPGALLCDAHILSDQEMARHEFYQDFLRPFGLRDMASSILINDSRRLGVCALHRSPSRGSVTKNELQLLSLLAPHLTRALELNAHLSAHEERKSELEEAFSRLGTGVVLFDRRGKVTFVNDAAQSGFSKLRLSVVRGSLEAQQPQTQRRLTDAFSRVLAHGESPPQVSLSTTEGRVVPVAFCALPSDQRKERALASSRAQAAAMMVFEGLSEPQTLGVLLKDAFGLTGTESQIAEALADGSTLKEIAADRDVSFHTIRTHVARTRTKLGSRNLTELVSQILKLRRSLLWRRENDA